MSLLLVVAVFVFVCSERICCVCYIGIMYGCILFMRRCGCPHDDDNVRQTWLIELTSDEHDTRDLIWIRPATH